ncbi:MAG: hydrogenase maturation protease [Longimicrobiaceae bacterium]
MIEPGDFWTEMEAPGPEFVVVDDVELRRGSRVLLRPSGNKDIFDLALTGQAAIVEGIEEDAEGGFHVAVTLEADPGRQLGEAKQPGHRFFFSLEEVEPLPAGPTDLPPTARILIAGIGNVFLGDDGFGVEVAHRLAQADLPRGVKVIDFGIRGMDLAYELQEGYCAAILVDATPRGSAPGTLYVIEPELPEEGPVVIDTHGMDPAKVLRLAQAMGRVPPKTLVVGCEPETVISGEDYDEMVMELSPPVREAVGEAMGLIQSLVDELIASETSAGSP